MHVVVFGEDVQAVPQDGQEVAALCPTAGLHVFEGIGHCSLYDHMHDVLDQFIRELVGRYLQDAGRHAAGRRPPALTFLTALLALAE